jgi:uncharacterized RDD family membrane protein YckC
MSSELFNVVFSGKIKDGVSIDEAQKRLVRTFKMPPEKVRKIFTGRPVTIKAHIELPIAQKYQRAFEGAGAICEILPVQKESEALMQAPTETAQKTTDKPSIAKPLKAKPQVSKTATFKPNLSGFWRRILAFVIDTVLLGVLGAILGFFFFDQFAKMGQSGRLIGFVLAILYFGLLNSSIGRGQTIGKRLMKIKVVSAADGTLISLPRSAWRYVLLCLPFLCNGLVLSFDNQIIVMLRGLIVFGVGGLLFYLYIFNRKTRQSFHDIAAKTLVIQSAEGGRLYQSGLWKGHFVVAVLWVLLVVGMSMLGVSALANIGSFPEMLTLQTELMKNPDIQVASVTSGETHNDNGETNWTAVTITVSDSDKMGEEIASEVALETFSSFPSAKQKDLLTITINYGYDIGISSRWKNNRYSYPPEKWESAVYEQQVRNPKIIEEKLGPNFTNYRVEGSLGKSHDLPCITIDQANNAYTPADLYASSAQCVMAGRDSDSAQIYLLAGVYAVYDASRVADKTARGARQVLVLNNFSPIDDEKKEGFKKEIKKITEPKTQESKEFCSKVKKLGKPDYHPQYMILHGMSNFLDGAEGDGLIADYDPDQKWEDALTALKWCNNSAP